MKLFLTLFFFILSTLSAIAQSEQTVDEPTQSVVLSEDGNSPTILLDRQEITQGELAEMDPNTIGSIEILTGKEAKDRFGKYEDFGAIVITSQKYAPVQSEKTVVESSTIPSEKVSVANSDEVKMSFGSDLNAHVRIDGQPSTMEILQSLKPDQIESMVVLKGEAAAAKYGALAKEGAIEVITKQ